MDGERLGKRYNKGEDIISRLPDDVLSHIISRLEAKDAVKTSVLSSRWKNVWTLIHNFCFNCPFKKRNFCFNLTTDGNEGNHGTLFVNFVELVLRRSQSKSIQKFHLKSHYDFQESDAACLIELIRWAVDRNVCSLTFKISFAEEETPMNRLPQSILTCKSLVKLSLGFSDFVLDIPDCTVCFPCLRFLSIYLYHPNSNSLQKLFRSCPILEELKIKGWQEVDGNALTFDINMPTLKKLKIHYMTDYDDDFLVHRFVVRAGNLENLEYLDPCNDDLACVLVGETRFLSKVILDNDVIGRLFNEHPEDEATMRATEFFRAISNTRFLSLVLNHIPVLCPPLGNLPLFPNLIHLYLGIDIVVGFALLVQFFNNSPNLEVLVLEEIGDYDREEVQFELECIPSCMLFHLKEVHLFLMDSNGQDLEVIKWFLENSKVLERFSVCFNVRKQEEDEQKIQNEILNFPKASPICEIEFVDYSCMKKLWPK